MTSLPQKQASLANRISPSPAHLSWACDSDVFFVVYWLAFHAATMVGTFVQLPCFGGSWAALVPGQADRPDVFNEGANAKRCVPRYPCPNGPLVSLGLPFSCFYT